MIIKHLFTTTQLQLRYNCNDGFNNRYLYNETLKLESGSSFDRFLDCIHYTSRDFLGKNTDSIPSKNCLNVYKNLARYFCNGRGKLIFLIRRPCNVKL